MIVSELSMLNINNIFVQPLQFKLLIGITVMLDVKEIPTPDNETLVTFKLHSNNEFERNPTTETKVVHNRCTSSFPSYLLSLATAKQFQSQNDKNM